MKFYILLIITFIFSLLSCCKSSKPYFPKKHPDLSKSEYEKFVNKLAMKYQNNDNYEIAFYLACLKAPNNLIDKHLKKAIENNPDDACVSIFTLKFFANIRFYEPLYMQDTLTYQKAFNSCLNILGENSYELFLEEQNKRVEELLPKIDSTIMDTILMKTFQKIYDDDQSYRTQIDILYNTEEENNQYLALQVEVDSINLIKVDSIINAVGCTKPEVIGYDPWMAIFLVLHHQVDINIRKKYRYFIEECYTINNLSMFDGRTSELQKIKE